MKADGPFVPYFEAAANVARAVAGGDCEKGIVICGTGAGSVITANKFQGVYATLAGSEFEGNRAAAINAANVLCLGEWLTPPKHAEKVVRAWLDTAFGEGFEPEWQEFLKDSCDKIRRIEQENFK